MKEIKIRFFSDIFSVQKLCWISLIAVLRKSLNQALSRRGIPNRNAWSACTFCGLCKRHHKCTNSRCGCLFNQKGRGQMHLWNEMDLPNRRPQAEIGLHWVICKLLATRREEESVRNVILASASFEMQFWRIIMHIKSILNQIKADKICYTMAKSLASSLSATFFRLNNVNW